MSTVPAHPMAGELRADVGTTRADRVRREHLFMLRISVLVVLLSFLLVVLPDGRHVAFRFAPGLVLPETCPFHALSHIDCPGCGLTRSYVSLAHGQWRESIGFHHIGWILALLTLAQIPYRLACLKWGRCPGIPRLIERGVPYLLIVLLIGNWLLKLSFGW